MKVLLATIMLVLAHTAGASAPFESSFVKVSLLTVDGDQANISVNNESLVVSLAVDEREAVFSVPLRVSGSVISLEKTRVLTDSTSSTEDSYVRNYRIYVELVATESSDEEAKSVVYELYLRDDLKSCEAFSYDSLKMPLGPTSCVIDVGRASQENN